MIDWFRWIKVDKWGRGGEGQGEREGRVEEEGEREGKNTFK